MGVGPGEVVEAGVFGFRIADELDWERGESSKEYEEADGAKLSKRKISAWFLSALALIWSDRAGLSANMYMTGKVMSTVLELRDR